MSCFGDYIYMSVKKCISKVGVKYVPLEIRNSHSRNHPKMPSQESEKNSRAPPPQPWNLNSKPTTPTVSQIASDSDSSPRYRADETRRAVERGNSFAGLVLDPAGHGRRWCPCLFYWAAGLRGWC
jgi:hypothetical protein